MPIECLDLFVNLLLSTHNDPTKLEVVTGKTVDCVVTDIFLSNMLRMHYKQE